MGAVAYQQVKRLASSGHDVTVFTLSQKDRINSDQIDYNVKYLHAFPKTGNAGFAPELLLALRKFDIIELHYPFYGAQEFVWLAKALKLLKKPKLIIWYHMDATFNNWLNLSWHLKTWLIQRSLIKKADKVCSASLDYVKNSKIKRIYKKYPDKFTEIPFGTNQRKDSVTSSDLSELKRKLNITDQKVILFVGGLDMAHYFKGVPVLIHAMGKLKDKKAKLVIVGEGDLKNDCKTQVSKLDLGDRVIFADNVNFNDLGIHYALSHVTVLPSITRAEAFGLVLVEAMTHGKPVIGSDLPGVRGVVGSAGLTVKPGDSTDLAEKIDMLLSDNELYKKLSSQALLDVQDKYNWPAHIKKLLKIYM